MTAPDTPKPTDEEINAALPEHLRWKGEGPMPASWFAADGTKVYRSYADYCMD